MNILVTGGLGFVGSNLVDILVKCNNVTVIDNLESESSNLDYKNEKAKYHIKSIDYIDNLTNDFDIIFHLAAQARIQPSFKDPLKWFDANASGTLKVLEFARKNNSKVIYSGSSSFYNSPYKSPYSFSKWVGEELLTLYYKVYNVPCATARFFNVYGPRQPNTTVIGIWENQYRCKKPLTIIGDGKQRRDFTHIYDICEGLIAVSKTKCDNKIYNLGTGENNSLNELADLFQCEKEYLPKRINEAEITLANLNQLLNWKSKINIKDYIKDLIIK